MSALAVQAVFLEDTGSRIAKSFGVGGTDFGGSFDHGRSRYAGDLGGETRNSKYPTPMPERTIRMANPVTQTFRREGHSF